MDLFTLGRRHDSRAWEIIYDPRSLPDPVVVEMNSTGFDTYLFVYDDDENIVAENDDFDGTTTDARVDLSLADGCYIVMATSFFIGDTGSYQLWFY